MQRHYLNVPFAEKDAAKALGARWDAAARRWYVESGRDLAEFGAWLPASTTTPVAGAGPAASRALQAGTSASAALAPAAPASAPLSLSALLRGVERAVADAFQAGVWTLVEVVELRARNHIYLEVAERDAQGSQIAKAGALIWASTAAQILPAFEQATGAVLGPGIKLLVRARPGFRANFGFRLEIDAIDPQYTLGDLEARKKEIRDRLQREGVFAANRRLPAPFDFLRVLVVAPEDAAGLGDFRKEAERLAAHGICHFRYVHSRFQGEGAAREIASALAGALQALPAGEAPDAIAIIRGGGAVNDLAWLNDYDLARFICDLPIPVFTGIGHERDSTMPDEVAHTRFDTPSKVIAGIERQILQRAAEARQAAQGIFTAAGLVLQRRRHDAERLRAEVETEAGRHLSQARQATAESMAAIRLAALTQLHAAATDSAARMHRIRADAVAHLQVARHETPALLADIRLQSALGLSQARRACATALDTTLHRSAAQAATARQRIDQHLASLAERAQGHVQRASLGAEALMREIAGQGPDKTLARGFALARRPDGTAVTSAHDAAALPALALQFHDGAVQATIASRAPREETP